MSVSMCRSGMLCVMLAASWFTFTARPMPDALRDVIVGYRPAAYRFMAEPLYLLRKWFIMGAGIALHSSYLVLLACICSFVVMWFVIVNTKPFATGSQFDARLSEWILVVFAVRPSRL